MPPQTKKKKDSVLEEVLAEAEEVLQEYRKESKVLALPRVFKFEKQLLIRPGILELPKIEKTQLSGLAAWFGQKLEITLTDLQAQFKEARIDEDAIDKHLRFYLRKGHLEICRHHLLCLAGMCIRQARLEQNKAQQIPLLFKAIDLLRMYIQYSEDQIDILASNVIVHIFSTFPKEFDKKLALEQQICKNYFQLFKIKKKFGRQGFGKEDSIGLRIQIARWYVDQRNYYDALLQFTKTLEIFSLVPKPDLRMMLNKVRTHIWIGNIYQELIHYAQPGQATLLTNFTYRYNRDCLLDKRIQPLPVFKSNDLAGIRQTKKQLVQLANAQYEEIQKMHKEMSISGYVLSEQAISQIEPAFAPHLGKIIKGLKGRIFPSQDEFSKKLNLAANPKATETEWKRMWYFITNDPENAHTALLFKLKNSPKWIDLCSDALFQMAKNYEFLEMRDQAVSYAQQAYSILHDYEEGDETIQKQRNLLDFIRRHAR